MNNKVKQVAHYHIVNNIKQGGTFGFNSIHNTNAIHSGLYALVWNLHLCDYDFTMIFLYIT